MVMIAGRPSGIAATASAMAASRASPKGKPRKSPSGRRSTATTTMAAVSHLLKTEIWRVSGVSVWVASPRSEEMRPSSVPFPVVTTAAVPVP
jgi:hypothetical protein